MKYLYILLIAVGVLFMANNVFATVGGPTYISEIAFSAKDNAVYYKVNDLGGRGCPPIVHKVDLATLEDSEVKSCTQVEKEFLNENYETGMQKYDQFLAGVYDNLVYLGSVSFKKNNIKVAVKFLSEYGSPDFPEEIFWSNFEAIIKQDEKDLRKINFKGCTNDQPHLFEGYIVPNSDKLAILISNKGDCFEGGYVRESLQVIKGVKYYDKDIVRSWKNASASEPNGGNLVVYAATGVLLPILPTEENAEAGNNNMLFYILAGVLGLGLGYFLRRKS